MIKGLRLPYYAEYTNTDGTVTYSGGGSVGKAVQYSVNIQKGDDNHAYADDGIAETDKGKFISGTLTLDTSNLSVSLSKTFFGLSEKTYTISEGNTVTANVYTDSDVSPDLGFGIIEWHQVDNADSFRAIVLPRVYFAVPEDAATTKGESISWQTKKIEGTIMRSDEALASGAKPWKIEAWFDNATAAEGFIKHVLGISSGSESET